MLQFAGSSLTLFLFWSAALGSFLYAIVSYSSPAESANLLLVAAGGLVAGLLLLPSAAYSLAALLGRQLPSPQTPARLRRWLPVLTFTGLALAILAGALLGRSQLDLLLSPFHVLAAMLSVAWLLWLGLRGLDLGSSQYRWGALASGLSAAPLLSITFEALSGLLVLLLGFIYLATNPALSSEIMRLQSIMPVLENDPQQLLQALSGILNDPIVLSLILTNFALFVPLIEELAKPIAVWLLVWRGKLSNAQGFGIGLLGGAGFGLLENLFSGAQAAEWAGTATVRIGATAFHMATAGLMGWAIVRAKNEGRYLAVFVVYAFNILLHGLWNGVVVWQSFALAGDSQAVSPTLGLILLAIALLSIAILIGMNARLQPKPSSAPAAPPAQPLTRRSRPTAKKRTRTK